jgi:uncharacterized Zn-binding protein involved in type VI secretion
MPAVCRVGDAHTCGSVDTGGSSNVFINSMAAHRRTDSQSHGGVQNDCSATVFVNGLGIARVGDFTLGEPPPPVMHGDNPEASGSPNVFAN